jgi:hypothetical protein
VRSLKTERFSGHEQRMVPIVPRLIQLLKERLEEVGESTGQLVSVRGAGGRRRKMVAIMDLAGVERWDDSWQTLRRSCEIEWAQTYPQYAVSRWIGHSITVSGRHNANAVPDELFDKVAAHQATQKAAQHPAESGRTEPQIAFAEIPQEGRNPAGCADLRQDAAPCENIEKWSRGESNPRAKTVSRSPLRVCMVI